MPEVLESRTHTSRTLRCGVKPSPVRARETSGSSGGVGYRLRQADDLIRTGSAFASTLTLVIMMAILETGIRCPLENHLFRWMKEAKQ